MCINDEIRLAEGENQKFSKLVVDSSNNSLHFVDSGGTDTNLLDKVAAITEAEHYSQLSFDINTVIKELDGYVVADGYAYVTKSINMNVLSGASYAFLPNETRTDSDKPDVYIAVESNYYMPGWRLSGSPSSAGYVGVYSPACVVPLDYAGGGIVEVYGYNVATGNMMIEIQPIGFRENTDVSLGAYYGGGTPESIISPPAAKALYRLVAMDVSCNTPAPGDVITVRIQRHPTHASDSNAGYLYITACNFIYRAAVPHKTYNFDVQ